MFANLTVFETLGEGGLQAQLQLLGCFTVWPHRALLL